MGAGASIEDTVTSKIREKVYKISHEEESSLVELRDAKPSLFPTPLSLKSKSASTSSIGVNVELNHSHGSGSGKTQRMPSTLRLKHQTSKTQLVLAHKSSMSLKALALRHYSRQENKIIQHDDISASFIETKEDQAGQGNINNKPIKYQETANNSNGSIRLTNNSQSSLGKRPNLKIQIHDDPDWVQVSDDEDDIVADVSPRFRKTLSLLPAAQQSYLFTQSGTIFVDGFHTGIGITGINSSSKKDKENNKDGDGVHLGEMKRQSSKGDGSGQQRLPMNQRLVVLCRLGAGASSIVYKAFDVDDLQLVAVKMVPVYDRAKRRQMVRELSALFMILRQRQNELAILATDDTEISTTKNISNSSMNEIVHNNANDETMKTDMNNAVGFENIVRFFDAFSNLEDGGCALCMEYMDGGSLQDIADAGGCSDECTLSSIARQALTGLAFLHSCHFIHRDIKPGNILIDRRGEVKVSDLGILRKLDPVPIITAKLSNNILDELDPLSPTSEAAADKEDNNSRNNKMRPGNIPRAHTFVGTAVYMAPERIDGRDYTVTSDVWSFGLTLLTVALGKLPIEQGGGYWGILHSIRDSPPPAVPTDADFSPEFRDFIAQCLKHNPDERPSCVDLLQHDFITKWETAEVAEPTAEDLQNLDTHEQEQCQRRNSRDMPTPIDLSVLNDEHYIVELQTILYGLYSHLEQLKFVNSNLGNTGLNIEAKDKNTHLVQTVKRLGAVGAMRQLLLGECIDEDNDSTGTYRMLQRLRISTLAKQMELDIDRTISEIEAFCTKLESGQVIDDDEDFMTAETPKAHHAPAYL
jgi:serine/threonine protein kinase